MHGRERMRRCYCHQETDRPGIYVRMGFPKNDPSYDCLKNYLQAHTERKAGWFSTQIEINAPSIESSYEPYSEDFRRRIDILHTPRGDLRSSYLESLRGQPGLRETYFINSADDAEKYLSLPLPHCQGDVAPFFAADTEIGEQGIAEVWLGNNPGGFTVELCGTGNFAMLSATDREIVHRLCARRREILMQRVKYLISRKVGPFFALSGEEYIVPPLHGPRDFQDFNVRYDKPIINLIHDAGGRAHVHSHGSIKSVFGGFIEAGADVLHPFEPPPQGNITAREAKSMAGDKLCLEGNIQIHRMYEAAPDEIREETRQLIADAFDDHQGLIVCPTASPYIHGRGAECFPRFKAMIDAVLEWKC